LIDIVAAVAHDGMRTYSGIAAAGGLDTVMVMLSSKGKSPLTAITAPLGSLAVTGPSNEIITPPSGDM
jgi:hypothetical protein